jgi:coproporphyrinogen III oxidase
MTYPSRLQLPKSQRAQSILTELTSLQAQFADGLDDLSIEYGDGSKLREVSWLRDGGQHGGGWRREVTNTGILNRASLNISTIHYDDRPDKPLRSATALSCIIHPQHPRAPSLHTHISWTDVKAGRGGWRLMADLNPALVNEAHRRRFLERVGDSLSTCAPEMLADAIIQGDRYFYIPPLERHRGVAHYYLEQWSSGSDETDLEVALSFGARVIETYLELLNDTLGACTPPTQGERDRQLHYHSVYFLQVLTLDRGTSSGLLVHDQNDAGILGSLPQQVDPALLRSWCDRLPAPQNLLLSKLIERLPAPAVDERASILSPAVRVALAQEVRAHYRAHPEALALQARGAILPPTVVHHTGPDESDSQGL